MREACLERGRCVRLNGRGNPLLGPGRERGLAASERREREKGRGTPDLPVQGCVFFSGLGEYTRGASSANVSAGGVGPNSLWYSLTMFAQ